MPVLFECKVDETIQSEEDACVSCFIRQYTSLTRAVIDAREALTLGMYPLIMKREFLKILSFLAYSFEHPSRRKRTVMDVAKMIEDWVPLVKQLACAHDVDEKDLASATLDELLLPVIAAPVQQIREFYVGLVEALKADKSVPWAVWRLFEFWGKSVLDKIDGREMVVLKKEIAGRIAERSLEQIPREDWIASLVGALQWRDPEKLEKIEKSMEAGHKPRLRGRESCLFLEVGQATVML